MGVLSNLREDLELSATELFNEYKDRLMADALRLCKDEALAEDLVMCTFEAYFFKKAKHNPERGSLLSWLRTVMHNLNIDNLRRRKVNDVAFSHEDIERFIDAQLPAELPDEGEQTEMEQSLTEAVNALSPKLREAVVLHYFESLPIAQVARTLRVTENSIKNRLFYARKVLARRLGKKLGKGVTIVALAVVSALTASAAAVATLEVFSPVRETVSKWWNGGGEAGVESAPVAGVASTAPASVTSTAPEGALDAPTNLEEDLQKEKTMKVTQMMKSVALAAVTSVATLGLNAVAAELTQVTLNKDDPGNTSSMNGAGSAAGWSDGTLEATNPAKEYVVDGYQLRTPQDLSDTYNFTGGCLTFKDSGTSTRFAGAGSKMNLRNTSKPLNIPYLKVATGEVLIEEGIGGSSTATYNVTLLGESWQVDEGATLWFSAFPVSNEPCTRQISVKANLAGEGTIRCAGEGASGNTAHPGKIFFLESDNSSFTGAFTTMPHKTPTEAVEVAFNSATSWFGNPSEARADGVTLSEKVKLIFNCSLDSTGSNRGFTFADGNAVISVKAGETVVIDAPIVAQNGFIKQGEGELVIASTESSVGGNILVKEGVLKITSDASLVNWTREDGGEVVIEVKSIIATIEGYEGLVDGDSHSPSCVITDPADGVGCTTMWSEDGGKTWSSTAPAYSTETNVTVRCRITCPEYPDLEKSVSMILWPNKAVYVSSSGSETKPYDTPATATKSLATALNLAIADDTIERVIMMPGEYDIVGQGQFVVTNGVSLEGAMGSRPVLKLGNTVKLMPGASISGFVILPYNDTAKSSAIFSLNDNSRFVNCQVRDFSCLGNVYGTVTIEDSDIGNVSTAKPKDVENSCGGYIFVGWGNDNSRLNLLRTSIHGITYTDTDAKNSPICLGSNGSSVEATECSFYDNHISGQGASSTIVQTSATSYTDLSATFDRCTFSNCTARNGFCRILDATVERQTSLTLKNCLLKDMCSIAPGNKTAQFFFFVNNTTLENCTFIDCRAADNVFLPGGSNQGSVTIKNTIFKDMKSVDGSAAIPMCVSTHAPSSTMIIKSLSTLAAPGNEIAALTWYPKDDDGNFEDVTTGKSGKLVFVGEGDTPYALKGDSFGRRMGANIWTAEDKDLAGKPRLNGNVCDLGCYQYYVNGFILTVW